MDSETFTRLRCSLRDLYRRNEMSGPSRDTQYTYPDGEEGPFRVLKIKTLPGSLIYPPRKGGSRGVKILKSEGKIS